MKNKGLFLGTTIGVGIGTALGVAIGTAIGIIALGVLKIDLHNDIAFWISTGMAVGGGISHVNHMFKPARED